MNILVINSGSSSIKFSIYASERSSSLRTLYDGELSAIGTPTPKLRFDDADGKPVPSHSTPIHASTIEEAIGTVEAAIAQPGLPTIDAVGYRVVHPGPTLDCHQQITPSVLEALRAAQPFAPLHAPIAVSIIETMMARLPRLRHYACFDTIFHNTMPEAAKTFPIPLEYRSQGVRRYGFHGLSCESVLAQLNQASIPCPARMVIAHLGSGCSVTALLDGRSIDTSMGLTPTGGIVMGTRPGDLDPGLVLYLLRQEKDTSEKSTGAALESLLNHHSGTAAVSGLANDLRAIRAAAQKRDLRAQLALDIFTRSIRKAIGSYAFLLGGLDAIVFTGGIGEHDAATRAAALTGLEAFGICLNPAANTAAGHALQTISPPGSPTAVYVIPAQEDRIVAAHVEAMHSAQASV